MTILVQSLLLGFVAGIFMTVSLILHEVIGISKKLDKKK